MDSDRKFEIKGQTVSCSSDCLGKCSIQTFTRKFGDVEVDIGYHEICNNPKAGTVKGPGGIDLYPICTRRTPEEALANRLLRIS